MKLSDAMRKGIPMTEPIARNMVFVLGDVTFACALGAACIGAGVQPVTDSAARKMWPQLLERFTYPDGSGDTLQLRAVITSLNDCDGWSREKIAEWLEGQGL